MSDRNRCRRWIVQPWGLCLLLYVAALVSLGVTFGAALLAIRFAPALGFIDQPSARKIHARAMPLLGGPAIAAGFASGLAWAWVGAGGEGSQPALWPPHGLLLGLGALALAIGLFDDRHPLETRGKLLTLLVPSAAAGAHLWWSGRDMGIGVADACLAAGFLLGLTNTMNFQDNMDGLLGGVAFAACAGIAVTLGTGAAPVGGSQSHLVPPVALAAACAGFLILNFRPARLFMGDAGSLFVGFVAGTIAVGCAFHGPPAGATPVDSGASPLIFLCLLFGLPICDGALVTASRLANRRVLTAGAKDHASHRLVFAGLEDRSAVLALYAVSAAFAALAVLYAVTRSVAVPILATVVVAPVWIWLYRLPIYTEREPIRPCPHQQEP